MANKVGQQTICLTRDIYILAAGSAVGKKEGEGPLGRCFDSVDEDDTFGQDSWEKAESAMQGKALHHALEKLGLSPGHLDWLFAGDLLNQCVSSSFAARGLHIPFFGLYGACSTMGEGLCLASLVLDSGAGARAAAAASSHRKCYRKTRRMKQSFGLYFFPGKGVRVMACKYLDFQDRKKIAKMYQEEARVLDIAYKIGCHPATIYEELRRGDTGKLDKNQRPEYDPRLAQRTFQEAIRRRGNRRTTTTAESGQ